MATQCPYCGHALALRDAKPGRYTTTCPKCTKKFLLGIPADPLKPPVVAAMKSQLESGVEPDPVAVTVAPQAQRVDSNATMPHGSAANMDPNVTAPYATERADDARATGAWTSAPDDANVTAGHVPTGPKGSASETDVLGLAPTAPETIAAGATQVAGAAATTSVGDMPTTLGGYQVLKELGRGGMGSVYLARQLSLGRNVALKTMKPQWASDPTFVARFTREAFAAAQLVHHNVVQIYDFGEDHGTSYFSMEFVEGQSLAELLRKQKKLDAEAAVGYVLQAARGLKYAHDQSMIHRDVKPDNLMINSQGIVKVADLGLVKTPALAEEIERREASHAKAAPAEDTALTRADIAMGTPAFMAPEQARDAAGVDARADIYALGCTLYDLVTGRPPFEGRTAMELITKHQSEPVIPPDAIVKRVPKALSDIILKMVAKRPEDRYQDLGAVIKDLEGFLGISSTGPFTPREEHAETIERASVQFSNAKMARIRPKVVLGFLGACLAAVILCAILRRPILAGAFLGLGVLTAAASFVIHGFRKQTALFLKTREFMFSSSAADWLTWIAALVLFVIALVLFKLVWVWVAPCVAAVGLALVLDRLIDRRIEAEHAVPVADAEALLKTLRLHGLEEDAIRQFVCKYSGDHWEAFYESLFGYDAKLVARDQWGRGRQGRMRPKHAAWRDPIVAWIDNKQRARKEAKEKKLLQRLEERSLTAKGENLVTARRKAERAAEAMVTMAAEMRAAKTMRDQSAAPPPPIAKALRDAASKPEAHLVTREKGLLGRRTGPLDQILGPRVRFLAGAALTAGCLLWMNQNGILSGEHLQSVTEKVRSLDLETVKSVDLANVKQAASDAAKKLARTETPSEAKPLELPMVPAAITRWFHGFGAGVAGLILLTSSLFRGFKITFFALPAALIAFLGPEFGIPAIGPLTAPATSMAVGIALLVAGILFGRRR